MTTTERQMQKQRQAMSERLGPIVAFDFDGTLTVARQLPRLSCAGEAGPSAYLIGPGAADPGRRRATCSTATAAG